MISNEGLRFLTNFTPTLQQRPELSTNPGDDDSTSAKSNQELIFPGVQKPEKNLYRKIHFCRSFLS